MLPLTVMFRCDATAKTGWGHVSRCVALAEAFGEVGWRAIFAGQYIGSAKKIIIEAGCKVINTDATVNVDGDAAKTSKLLSKFNPKLTICDSYSLDRNYLDTLRRETGELIVFDDFGDAAFFSCDAVINFTMGAVAKNSFYSQRLRLLGPAYFPARKNIRRFREQISYRTCAQARHVLVALGGSDEHGLSLRVLHSLLGVDSDVEVHVITGSRNRDIAEIEAILKNFGNTSYYLHGIPDLAAEYAWADLCIAGGGLTKYEALFMGLPTAVISMNEGQYEDTMLFENRGAVMNLGLSANLNTERLAKMLCRFMNDLSVRASLATQAIGLFPDDTTCCVVDALRGLIASEKEVSL